MHVERSDILKLAELARIEITDATVDEVAARLTDVLALVDQLQAADTDSIRPMAHPLDAVQTLRADTITESNQREAFQEIAPATENGLYLVPKVIE
ncbi:Asp-tRNA(Asn)/Glu-tRNA(Gln) amidotransferase subunit GatC [Marinibactrum halimedae]|nr:Asp-tRNA(Asn)/Glu-tRNA(Gln) amidotransferase subunit GatC [Marinibactrum halimedae]MCD9458084.1 Asp-tRNA(Asn)/Glu-tRNA(Gln) amidotransferase subunit GatC [Marinibactrum halimedae]